MKLSLTNSEAKAVHDILLSGAEDLKEYCKEEKEKFVKGELFQLMIVCRRAERVANRIRARLGAQGPNQTVHWLTCGPIDGTVIRKGEGK